MQLLSNRFETRLGRGTSFRVDEKKMTWPLGDQPSPAEVVKGEKEALD